MTKKSFRLYKSTEATARQFTDVVMEHINNGETEGKLRVNVSDNLLQLMIDHEKEFRHMCNKILAEATGSKYASIYPDTTPSEIGWLGDNWRCPKRVQVYFDRNRTIVG